MNASVSRVSSIVLLAISISAAIAGCAEIRKLTYPKDFVYLDRKEVEGMMQSMSDDMVRLNQLLADAPETDTEKQKKIVAELDSIERTALRLSGGHKQTNQFYIGEHIGDFIDDVGTAKMFASSNPPRYGKARDVTNACQECHQFR
jgi:uncharacterized protein YceK